jgi:hypothetical protein
MIYAQLTRPQTATELPLPEELKYKSQLPLSNHIWVQTKPMFARLGMLNNQRCSKCGTRLNCAGICLLIIK